MGSILGERLPEEDVRVVETAENPHQQDVPVLPGAQRRKLYFNPAYFDRQLLLVSCLTGQRGGKDAGEKCCLFPIRASHPRVFEVWNAFNGRTLNVCSIRLRSYALDQRQDNLKTARRFSRPHLRLPSSSCSKSEKSSPSPNTRWLQKDLFLFSMVSAVFFKERLFEIINKTKGAL